MFVEANGQIDYWDSFGYEGFRPGEFSCPSDVKVWENVSQHHQSSQQNDATSVALHTDLGTETIMMNSVASVSASYMIFVSDSCNNRIQVFNESFQFLFSIGRRGTGEGEFNMPRGLAISQDGYLVVCDQDNHRIQVFDVNRARLDEYHPRREHDHYMFVTMYGSPNNEPSAQTGEFDRPTGVCIAPNGYIVVNEVGNKRIQVFSSY